jgi:hypothetical protein
MMAALRSASAKSAQLTLRSGAAAHYNVSRAIFARLDRPDLAGLRRSRRVSIAEVAGDLVRALEPAKLTATPKLLLTALVERLEAPASG